MVASWFVYAVYALIATACALLIPDETKRVLIWFGQLQMRPSVQQHLQKIVALELLSFVSLFGIGLGLLEYHRFGAAIFVFSLGCAVLAVSFLLATFGLQSWLLKVAIAIAVYALAFEACEYLMDIVQQGETEYNATIVAKAIEVPPNQQRRPKERDKDIIEQHETQDRVSAKKNQAVPRPNLVATLDQLTSLTIVGRGSAFLIKLTISNDSSVESVAIGFPLQVSSAQHKKVFQSYPVVIDQLGVQIDPSTGTVLTRAENLAVKATAAPIRRGLICSGFLLYPAFDQPNVAELLDEGMVWEVKFQDYQRNNYTLKRTIGKGQKDAHAPFMVPPDFK